MEWPKLGTSCKATSDVVVSLITLIGKIHLLSKIPMTFPTLAAKSLQKAVVKEVLLVQTKSTRWDVSWSLKSSLLTTLPLLPVLELELSSCCSWEYAFRAVLQEDWPPKIRTFENNVVCFSTSIFKPDIFSNLVISWISYLAFEMNSSICSSYILFFNWVLSRAEFQFIFIVEVEIELLSGLLKVWLLNRIEIA